MLYQTLIGEKLTPEQITHFSDWNWIRANARHIYKDKVNILAEVSVTINGVERTAVVKLFGWRNRISRWLSPFMRSRAQKSWDASLDLLKCGVKVPPPIAVYTRRRFGIIQRNFLLTGKIENYTLARNLLRDPDYPVSDKNLIVAALADLIRKMHTARMVHHDLTLGNFLVNRSNPREITIVDLNRLERRIFLSRSLKMYDIAKLNLCECNLEREHSGCRWILFLKCYAEKEFAPNRIALQTALSRRKIKRRIKAMHKPKKSKTSGKSEV
jgi:tRNA A-37 threonylcarbamoyl transferase component Bud32